MSDPYFRPSPEDVIHVVLTIRQAESLANSPGPDVPTKALLREALKTRPASTIWVGVAICDGRPVWYLVDH